MLPCSKCLELNWRFSFDDKTRMVTAVCINCETEVSFAAKQRHKLHVDPDRLKPFSLAHRYVPGGRPVDRPNCAPWDD